MTAETAVAPRMRADLRRLHLTGSPVTVRPMTRRWISDVPSKIVKILAAGFRGLFTQVNAGSGLAGVDSNAPERPPTPPSDPSLLPAVLPAGTLAGAR